MAMKGHDADPVLHSNMKDHQIKVDDHESLPTPKKENERDVFLALIRDISSDLDVAVLSHKILTNVAILTSADRCSLFLVKGTGKTRALVATLFDVNEGSTLADTHERTEVWVPWGKGIIGHVAVSGESVNIPDAYEYEYFNKEVDQATGYRTKAVMCQPVKNTEGEVIGVAEVINKLGGDAFTSTDEDVFHTYLTFCGISLTKAKLFESSRFSLRNNEVLLRMARGILQEQSCLKTVVHTILVEAQEMIQCQLCSVMIVDKRCESSGDIEFSRVFELTHEQWEGHEESSDEKQPGETTAQYLEQAKTVAKSGKLLNTTEFDSQHSLVVKHSDWPRCTSLLCLPIYNKDKKIIGVMLFLNKLLRLCFDDEDERVFEAFAVFCGLGINNIILYDNMRKAMARRKVALEVLSYHALSSHDEAMHFVRLPLPASHEFPSNLTGLSFDDTPLSDDDTIFASLRMFKDSGVMDHFRINHITLTRWLLSVKKNYRKVIYHNWRHAFNVVQCMFAIFMDGNMLEKLSPMERLTLLVACLCHDLDHRGTTNTFQTQSSSPLADLYSTSTMEHHHFDHSIMILNSEGNNIFENMDSGEYAEAIKMIENDILATDLALYFKKRTGFVSLVDGEKFEWENDSHRDCLRSMLMTACDLSAITKPWPIQRRVAHLVASEFFEQGDIEKSHLNKQPIPMMDREKKDDIPKMQVGFIDAICIPLYKIFAKLWPPLNPLFEGVQSNRQKWQTFAEKGEGTKSKETVAAQRSCDDARRKQTETEQQKKNANRKDNAGRSGDGKKHHSVVCTIL